MGLRDRGGGRGQTREQDEGRERTASEGADLIYHAMGLLAAQVGGWARAVGAGAR